jgi:F0F1-type ATP synthase epsilon subunit
MIKENNLKEKNKYNRSGFTSFFYKGLSIESVKSNFPQTRLGKFSSKFCRSSAGTLVQVYGTFSIRLRYDTLRILNVSPIELLRNDEFLKSFPDAIINEENNPQKTLFHHIISSLNNSIKVNDSNIIHCEKCLSLEKEVTELRNILKMHKIPIILSNEKEKTDKIDEADLSLSIIIDKSEEYSISRGKSSYQLDSEVTILAKSFRDAKKFDPIELKETAKKIRRAKLADQFPVPQESAKNRRIPFQKLKEDVEKLDLDELENNKIIGKKKTRNEVSKKPNQPK